LFTTLKRSRYIKKIKIAKRKDKEIVKVVEEMKKVGVKVL